MTISEKQRAITEEFLSLADWQEKYEMLIDLGKSSPAIPEGEKKDGLLIEGCQSKVWLKPEFKGDKLYFYADSDALIPKGIAGLLIRIFSGHKPQDIAVADIGFLDAIGLRQFLSPMRSNGLSAMLSRIKLYASAYQARAGQL